MFQSILAVAILYVDLVFQSSIFPYLKIGGVMPNTAIVFVVSFAILRGRLEGLAFGFLMGLLYDLYFGNAIGFTAIIYMYIAYFSGTLTKDFFPENLFMPILFSGAGAFIHSFLYYIFYFFLLGKINLGFYMQTIILPETIYTTVISIFIYIGLYNINKPIRKYELSKRKLF